MGDGTSRRSEHKDKDHDRIYHDFDVSASTHPLRWSDSNGSASTMQGSDLASPTSSQPSLHHPSTLRSGDRFVGVPTALTCPNPDHAPTMASLESMHVDEPLRFHSSQGTSSGIVKVNGTQANRNRAHDLHPLANTLELPLGRAAGEAPSTHGKDAARVSSLLQTQLGSAMKRMKREREETSEPRRDEMSGQWMIERQIEATTHRRLEATTSSHASLCGPCPGRCSSCSLSCSPRPVTADPRMQQSRGPAHANGSLLASPNGVNASRPSSSDGFPYSNNNTAPNGYASTGLEPTAQLVSHRQRRSWTSHAHRPPPFLSSARRHGHRHHHSDHRVAARRPPMCPAPRALHYPMSELEQDAIRGLLDLSDPARAAPMPSSAATGDGRAQPTAHAS